MHGYVLVTWCGKTLPGAIFYLARVREMIKLSRKRRYKYGYRNASVAYLVMTAHTLVTLVYTL